MDLYETEGFNRSRILTRGSILYVVNKDEQDKKQVWYDNIGSQVYKVLTYDKERKGFMELELNKGLTVDIDSIMIVKENGILFATPVIRELMISDSKEG